MNGKAGLGEVLFEITQLGNAVRVAALHVDSNTEVAIVGPSTAPQVALQEAALQKLRYILAKRKGG